MIEDHVRMDAFQRALAVTVTPDSTVLDLGAGTGVMALLACRCGARRVYAIEPTDAIQLGREAALANGCAERIVFIQGRAADIELPEKADLIVEDMRGISPWFGTHLPDLADARRRLLAPGGRVIPRRDAAYAGVVEAEETYRSHMGPWQRGFAGLDLGAGARYAANTFRKVTLGADALIAPAQAWASIDYMCIPPVNAAGSMRFIAGRPGTAHGIALWFDAELADGIGFSNAPGATPMVYGQMFFPWPQPVALAAGDRIEIQLRADLTAGDYVWSWDSRIERSASDQGEALRFRQTTFQSVPLTNQSLARRAAGSKPVLAPAGAAARHVLDQMQGSRTLEEIGADLARAFPQRYPSAAAGFEFAARVAAEFGK